jgi:hypothetical protein
MGSEGIFGRLAEGVEVDSSGSGEGPVVGPSECGPSVSSIMEIVMLVLWLGFWRSQEFNVV